MRLQRTLRCLASFKTSTPCLGVVERSQNRRFSDQYYGRYEKMQRDSRQQLEGADVDSPDDIDSYERLYQRSYDKHMAREVGTGGEQGEDGLTHVDRSGRARMVDVSRKVATSRTAVAEGRVWIGKLAMRKESS